MLLGCKDEALSRLLLALILQLMLECESEPLYQLNCLCWHDQNKQSRNVHCLCLNKEMGNHDIIPRPQFFLSSYRSFFI